MNDPPLPGPADIQRRIRDLLPGLLGVEIIEVGRDRVVGRLAVRPEIGTSRDDSGRATILHGGGFMTFADALGAIGTFMNLPAGSATTTIESNTRFLASARVGSVLTGVSLPMHKGRTTMVWQTMIRDENERLCAAVTQTQLLIRPGTADETA